MIQNEAKWADFLRSDTSPKAKILYLFICEYDAKYGRCYVRQNTFAKQLKWSKRTVIRCLDELERCEWITRKRLRSSCLYHVRENMLNELPPASHINRVHSLNSTNTKYTTKNTKKLPDMAKLAKSISRGYKMKVNEPNTPAKTTKAQHDKKIKFLESMDKYDREKFWKLYMAGKVKLPWDIKL
tara:strand:- start:6615 stop:7166 length:552 start_codon:yes stop_codon:yes gene_type:complete